VHAAFTSFGIQTRRIRPQILDIALQQLKAATAARSGLTFIGKSKTSLERRSE
jgi:uncharacterized protein with von Willebrand factor type A (vWA) domain